MSRAVRIAAVAATGGLMAAGVTIGLVTEGPMELFTSLIGPFWFLVAAFLVFRVPENRVS